MKYLRAGTIKRIHVDRRVLAMNRKHGTKEPAWTIQTSKGPIKCREWWTTGLAWGSGPEAKQLSCGARMYIVTYAKVEYR